MANILDRVVGYLDPDRGLRRIRSRELLKRAYEGASKKDGWRVKRAGASPAADHRADAAELRVRARSLRQNVPYIAQGARFKVAQIVGTGIKPRSQAKVGADKLDKAWSEMVGLFDADARVDIYGLQGLAFAAMDGDGEVLMRIRWRRPGDGLPVPVQFQLLEIDWLDSARNERRGTNQIVNGIEYDQLGKVYGYWLFDEHPGEALSFTRRRSSSHFVPAENVIHLFNPERPGQGRGFSSLAPVVARVRDLQLYEDAELARKNQEARLGVIASGDVSLMANSPVDLSQPGDPAYAKSTGDLGILPSGGITQVPDGVNLTVVEPKAMGGYTDYVRQNLGLIAAGYGVTYEGMTGDCSQSNFSSSRSRMIDFRREAEMLQWLTLIPKLIEPMWRAFVKACELADIVSKADYAVEFSTPKWDYVDPDKDVKADIAEIGAGLSSISEKLRRRGYDPKTVFAEIASDFDALKDLGILDILMFLQRGASPDSQGQAEQSKSNARMLDSIGQVLARMQQSLASLEARTTEVNVKGGDTHVSVPERSVTVAPAQVQVDVQPAQATVEVRNEGAQIHMPEQAAPVVHLTAEMPAPQVRITNEVAVPSVTFNTPARTLTSEVVERDGQGRIVRTVQREG